MHNRNKKEAVKNSYKGDRMNIRKLARPAAALLAAAALMAGSLNFGWSAGGVPEYLTSVTYFGAAWPINYWGTEDDNRGQILPASRRTASTASFS